MLDAPSATHGSDRPSWQLPASLVRPDESPNLGWLSSNKEAYNNPGRVSPASDPGGRSYGLFQLNTEDHVAELFLREEGAPFAAGFGPDPKSSTDGFKAEWQRVAREQAEAFAMAQYAFAKRRYFEPGASHIQEQTELDIRKGHWTFQEVTLSTMVQHGEGRGGGASRVLDAALAKSRLKERMFRAETPKTADQSAYEAQRDFIIALYDERGRRDERGMVYFRKAGPKLWPGISKRFEDEKALALKMLQAECHGRVTP